MSVPAAEPRKRPKLAAVFTEFTCRSHAHVILENFLEPYLFDGRRTDPGAEIDRTGRTLEDKFRPRPGDHR